MRLIDADATIELLRSLGSRDYRREKGTIADAMKMLSHDEYTPTIEAVEIDVVKKWLYAIAMNNVGQAVEDMAAACEEIASRLDGLRRFAEERRSDDG